MKDKFFLYYFYNGLQQKLLIDDLLYHKNVFLMEQYAIRAHIFYYKISNMIYNL